MAGTLGIKFDKRALQQLEREAPGRADAAMRRIAFRLEAVIKNSFGTSPSAPGQTPGVDTGALKNSIHMEQVRRGVYRVSDGVEYGVMLEYGTRHMAARPWMAPALREIVKEIPAELKAVIK